MFSDSHCHLNFPDFFDNLPLIFEEMLKNHVTRALCVGVDWLGIPSIIKLIDQNSFLWGSVGLHPSYDKSEQISIENLVAFTHHPKIVAIGETGLDYFHSSGDLHSQRDRFRAHIKLAKATKKPLIVHTRSSSEDTLKIMYEENASEVGGVIHCFTETRDFANAVMEMNFYISFSGIITFKNAFLLREIVKLIPMNRLLIETDSPYLAPVPHRGKINQPAYIKYVAQCISDIKGLPVAEVARTTTENFLSLFKITN